MLLAGEMLTDFPKCASDWGNSKKIKDVKKGGTMFVHKASIHKHGSYHFNILTF